MFFYSAISIILIALGFLFCAKVIGLRSIQQSVVKNGLSQQGFFIVIGLIGICTVVLCLYIRQIPGIPIIALLTDGILQAKILRSAATNDFSGHYYRYGLFIDVLLPFLTFVLFSNALTRHSRLAWISFLLTCFLAFFVAVMLTMKAKAIWLILGLLFTYCLTKATTIQVRYLFGVGFVSLILLVFMYINFMGMHDRPISEVISAIFSRTFTGQITPAYFYLEMFPGIKDYLLGRSFPNPGGVFPWEHYRITVEVMNYMVPSLVKRGIVGSAPTVYWAEIYANFGPAAPFVVAPVLSFFLYTINWFITRLKSSPVQVALISWLSIHLMKIASTGLSNYIFDLEMYTVIFIAIFLLFIEGKGRIPIRKLRDTSENFIYRSK